MKLGLDPVRGLLAELGRPDAAFPSVLIGGTNGKGSVAAALDAIFSAGGLLTGLYTSPHLVRVEERIRVHGRDIDAAAFDRQLGVVRAAIDAALAAGRLPAHPSFFEVMTAAALLSFRDAGVELAILEVGLGGRLDATNAVDPIVSAVVSVDFDHMDRLGHTIAEIAAEKAGIVRARRPFVSGTERPEALAVLRAAAERAGARFVDARAASRLERCADGSFAIATERASYARLRTGLAGEHQVENARCAVVVAEAVAEELGRPLAMDAVREGLARVRWAGRLQWVEGDPPVLLDGAHNPAGAAVLAEYLRDRGGLAPVLVFGASEGKDLAAILSPLRGVVAEVVVTRSSVERSASADKVAAVARALFPSVEIAGTPGAALDRARNLARGSTFVLVAGSLYLVGEVLKAREDPDGPGPISL